MAIYQNLDVRDIPGERWKRLNKYETARTFVEVSDYGRIKTIVKNSGKKRILKQYFNNKGYLRLMLGGKNYLSHRLIAEAFVENPNNKETVNHQNGIKHDNRIANLEYATYTEQSIHLYENGLSSVNTPIVVVNSNGEYIGEYRSRFELYEVLGRVGNNFAIDKYDNKVWFKDNKAFIAKDFYETLTENELFIIGTELFEHTLKNMFLIDGQLIDGFTEVSKHVGCTQSNVSYRTKNKTTVTINEHEIARVSKLIGVGGLS